MSASSTTDLRTTAARRRAQLVSDGVTAAYLHELSHTQPRRPASPARLRAGARPGLRPLRYEPSRPSLAA